jgi:hypothetical protein
VGPCTITPVKIFTVWSGVTPTAAEILSHVTCSCGNPIVTNIVKNLAGTAWTYDVSCTSAKGCTATATGRVNIETPCTITPDNSFTVCSGVTPTAAEIESHVTCSCGNPIVTNIVKNQAGTAWTYDVSCTSAQGCLTTATGIVNIGQPCEISFFVFSLPPEYCPGDRLPDAEDIIDLGVVNCGCGATPVISNIHWVSQPSVGEWTGEYTITCTSADGCISIEKGQFTHAQCQVCSCAPTAPNLCGCRGFKFPMDLFTSKGGGCHPVSGCDVTPTPVIDDSKVDYTKSGHSYPYTVTCPECTGNNVATGYIFIRAPLCGPNLNGGGLSCTCPTTCSLT